MTACAVHSLKRGRHKPVHLVNAPPHHPLPKLPNSQHPSTRLPERTPHLLPTTTTTDFPTSQKRKSRRRRRRRRKTRNPNPPPPQSVNSSVLRLKKTARSSVSSTAYRPARRRNLNGRFCSQRTALSPARPASPRIPPRCSGTRTEDGHG